MGMNMYGFIEVKLKGKWHAYDQFSDIANDTTLYDIIGMGPKAAIARNRGIPKDASVITKAEFAWWKKANGADWPFDETWLTSAEMAEAISRYMKVNKLTSDQFSHKASDSLRGLNILNRYAGFSIKGHYMLSLLSEKGFEDVRGVFWFTI
jgi:hypothetical protein